MTVKELIENLLERDMRKDVYVDIGKRRFLLTEDMIEKDWSGLIEIDISEELASPGRDATTSTKTKIAS